MSILLMTVGCSHLRPEKHEYAYVSARQVYLHDRVAAVSNRVALVTNGEALEVLERGRRFLKVRTPKGEIGWLEEHAVIDDKLYAQFEDLAKKHAQDTPVATATLRDDLYLHVAPGRDTEHFLVIPGNAKVALLARGTVEKVTPGAAKPKPVLPSAPTANPAAVDKTNSGKKPVDKAVPSKAEVKPLVSVTASASPAAAVTSAPTPVPMEDWWLVRDTQGHTGWLLSGRVDVEIPDEVGGYAEGARMVAAYPLAKVRDYEVIPREERSKGKAAGKTGGKAGRKPAEAENQPEATDRPMKDYTEYVTFLSPIRSGLPYDFDQVRVFTWSLNHHRYETAFRLRGIQGYLPVKLTQETVKAPNGPGMQSEPVFSFLIADGPNVKIDPDTGIAKPVSTRTLSFRLEGNLVKRTGADQAPIVAMHSADEADKAKAGGKMNGKAGKKKKR